MKNPTHSTPQKRRDSPATAPIDTPKDTFAQSVRIATDTVELEGDLVVPADAAGIVLFAHGSGSSRLSPRNQFVARTIQAAGIGTLLFDLMTPDEEKEDAASGSLRFNIWFLALRLLHATRWINNQPATRHLGVGYFGSSTGGAAALVAAAELGPFVQAVVSRGGRPDLAGDEIANVHSPTLLIVGELDDVVIHLNEDAYERIRAEKQFSVVPNATHLFEEPGALEEVASQAAQWFRQHLHLREP
ncbi:MAG TPA: dienelactone hydrolase family protein [Opitutaceae bacterium]